ncbi:MAG: peptidoglycan recognition family protein [Candidatus Ozemobacteraceae bacterium]
MRKWSRLLVVVFALFALLTANAARASEDTPDFQTAVNQVYALEGETYGQFETPIYTLEKSCDNLLISTDINKAPHALVRSYARFLNEKTGHWTRYAAFEGEFHFAAIVPVTAYQLLFVIRDPEKGKTEIQRFTVQGRKLGEELMEALTMKPVPFEATQAWAKPQITSRAEWKARPAKSEYTPQQAQKVILHHSWSPSQAQYQGAATMRGIQNYHMDDPKTGWMDIGYHFLIGPDGVIYQGRPEKAVGAHCPPNTNMVGICVIGNYDPNADQVNDKIETSLINLLSWLSSTYHIDPKTAYFGHRNFSSKTCPGDMIYNRLSFYQEKVLQNIGGGK